MSYESIFSGTMADMSWVELEGCAKRGVPVLLPIGVIEEHGPHLPLGTDIYFSVADSRGIADEIRSSGGECLIAPPYYWGVNHCTGGFPGSFSLKPETMTQVLCELLGNLKQFGFTNVFCINEHGDPLHNRCVLDAARYACEELGMNARVLMPPMGLDMFSLSGDEPYVLVDRRELPPLSTGDEDPTAYDIHAGEFETAAMKLYYGGLVDTDKALELPDNSLRDDTMAEWSKGGAAARAVVPLGYAGNPAAYGRMLPLLKPFLEKLTSNAALAIMEACVGKKD